MVQPVNGKAWQGHSARTAAVGALVLALVAGLAGCGEPSPAELISQARTALAKKDTEAARISLKSALQQAPDNGEARFLLGEEPVVVNALGQPLGLVDRQLMLEAMVAGNTTV